jgi:hypothetical protein
MVSRLARTRQDSTTRTYLSVNVELPGINVENVTRLLKQGVSISSYLPDEGELFEWVRGAGYQGAERCRNLAFDCVAA